MTLIHQLTPSPHHLHQLLFKELHQSTNFYSNNKQFFLIPFFQSDYPFFGPFSSTFRNEFSFDLVSSFSSFSFSSCVSAI
ncbi:unnamed protein product [Meloidogyne enterolobii]|uniref:Uncharacterized protein n=1 Tax=Meloidogyne enterolobii TaxID=390850 RepID=A0ACB0ZTU5_MELEN